MTSPATPEAEESETKFDLRLWQRFLAVAKPYWVLGQKWHAWGLLFALLLLLLSSTACSVWLNRQLGESTSALAAQDSETPNFGPTGSTAWLTDRPTGDHTGFKCRRDSHCL